MPGPDGYFGVDEIRAAGVDSKKSLPWSFVTDIVEPSDWFYALHVVNPLTSAKRPIDANVKRPIEFKTSNRDERFLSSNFMRQNNFL